jgi:hypothetical protein
LELVRTRDAAKAHALLKAQLRKKVPAVLCVDDWGHWITAVRYESTRFVVIDSSLDPVLNALSWAQLYRRWRFLDTDYDREDPPEIFDFYAVKPRFRVAIKASFSLSRLRFLRRSENRRLALRWNDYLEDLLEICRPPSPRYSAALTMAEFLRRNQELIISRVAYWHGDIDRDVLVRLMRDFRFVAETYGLVIPNSSQRRAVADLAVLTALAAAAVGGFDEIYGLGSS